MMIGDRERQARYQSDFYQIQFHRILNALLFSCVIILGLIATIIYLILHETTPNFYATTLGGQIIQMVPMQ